MTTGLPSSQTDSQLCITPKDTAPTRLPRHRTTHRLSRAPSNEAFSVGSATLKSLTHFPGLYIARTGQLTMGAFKREPERTEAIGTGSEEFVTELAGRT
jgi:hypothetical protein